MSPGRDVGGGSTPEAASTHPHLVADQATERKGTNNHRQRRSATPAIRVRHRDQERFADLGLASEPVVYDLRWGL